jgi:hypothetical protein
MDDLRRDPTALMAGLYDWLGLDTPGPLDLSVRNPTRYPRSKRLAATARSLKRGAERLHVLPPSAQQRLRGLYSRVNSGELTERMSPDARRHVEEIYRESTAVTERALTAHGYTDLPSWLHTGSPA